MTFSFLWFAVGLAIGVMVTSAGLWWSLRRENRKPKDLRLWVHDIPEDISAYVENPDSNVAPLASRRADQ